MHLTQTKIWNGTAERKTHQQQLAVNI